ncbi:hypothetical protein DAEQUDRAFT_763271 [Daedalea quercina L-15889]|uniref:Uncharacterized protein n=1 Tax=Daedalea quercina L-15889 TaxID=1314783 RepID=A0A165SL56_9APHY|nr:hypothetical protein DAEQUDRAFT_763271 [Daedalea quercina L-15889]
MALKRKMDFDDEVAEVPMRAKQQKLVPFPNSQPDNDVAMTDASVYQLEPLFIPIQPFHIRLPSDASYSSSTAGDSPRVSPAYPYFDLYPAEDHGFPAFDYPVPEAAKSVGLLQPKNPSFAHHG